MPDISLAKTLKNHGQPSEAVTLPTLQGYITHGYDMVEKLDINRIVKELGGHSSKNVLHSDGIRVAVITCDTFVDFTDINYKSNELLYLLKGKIKLETERGPIYAKEGELVVIPKGLKHGPAHGEGAVMLEIEKR